jgi:hypothetical protein
MRPNQYSSEKRRKELEKKKKKEEKKLRHAELKNKPEGEEGQEDAEDAEGDEDQEVTNGETSPDADGVKQD